MEIIHTLEDYKLNQPSIITIGTFDGLHIGHQKIISDLVAIAEEKKLCSIVLTFFPHPRMVLQEDNVKMIDTVQEKQKFLENLGLNVLIIHPFSKIFSRLTAIEFVRDILVNKLKVSQLVVGYDHRFGRNREATISDLKNFGEAYNFSLDVIPPQKIFSIAVSSTKIRSAIKRGEIKTANEYLGRSFTLTGKVVKGDGIGRKLGFPTANIKINEDYKIRPAKGVYLIKSSLPEGMFFGMMNIGKRPTIKGKKNRIEVHFFFLNQDLYNLKFSVEILEKIRSEKKFDSLENLRNQLVLDEKKCKKMISDKLKN